MTNLQRHMTQEQKKNNGMIDENGNVKDGGRLKTVEQGAATTVWACVAPELEGKGGLYLENCQISPEKSHAELLAEISDRASLTYMPVGIVPYAKNEETAKKLWDLSVKEIEARRK